MNILIVDNDFSVRKQLLRLLSEFGTCDIACNEKEALYAFKSSTEETTFYHLIFMDASISNIVEEIRNIEEQKGISREDGTNIIIMDSLKDNTLGKLLSLGCSIYINKPIEEDVVIEKMKELKLI